jgi:hypothetical protein
MASGLHVFLAKHTDGQAHPHQVSKIAAPTHARQASLPALTPKSRTPNSSTWLNLTSNDENLNTQECLRAL